MLTKAIVKLVASLVTEVQETLWLFWLASQVASWAGLVTVKAHAVVAKRTAERTEKARMISAGREGKER